MQTCTHASTFYVLCIKYNTSLCVCARWCGRGHVLFYSTVLVYVYKYARKRKFLALYLRLDSFGTKCQAWNSSGAVSSSQPPWTRKRLQTATRTWRWTRLGHRRPRHVAWLSWIGASQYGAKEFPFQWGCWLLDAGTNTISTKALWFRSDKHNVKLWPTSTLCWMCVLGWVSKQN